MKTRLTDMAIKKLPLTSEGQITHWDELTPGFGIRCSAKSKSFVIMYGKNRRLKTIGRYPSLSLADARKKAKVVLSSIPSTSDEPTPISVPDAVEMYLQDCKQRLRQRTFEEYRLYLNTLPFKGLLAKLTRSEINNHIESMRGRPATQNHAFTAIKVFLNWAAIQDFIKTNPLQASRKPHRATSRDRVLKDNELTILLQHTLEHRAPFNDIVSLLILTGQRRGEIAGLEWSDIDGEHLSLPMAKTKNKRNHKIPLGPKAIGIIQTIAGTERYLFANGDAQSPFSGWSKSKARLDRETGLHDYTLHDLRRTFATTHAKIGTPIHVTEKLLNHVSGTISGVAAVYNRHSYMDEMRTAVSEYDAYLENLINP